MSPVVAIRLLALCLALSAPAALAQTAAGAPGGPAANVPEPLRQPQQAGQYLELYIAQGMMPLRAADIDNDGLDAGDVQAVLDATLAQSRAAQAMRLIPADGDRDGRITRDEAAAFASLGGGDAAAAQRRTDETMRFDKNGDGVVDFAEMRLLAPETVRPVGSQADRLRALLALDPNGDGRLTGAEFTLILTKTFAAIDSNGDWLVDQAEADAWRDAFRGVAGGSPAIPAAAADRCFLPPPGTDDLIVALNASFSAAVADVSVAGPDEATGAIRLSVEAGDRPVYLVLSSVLPVVWQVEGAAGRLSRVVLLSAANPKTGDFSAGVAGVPAGKVAYDGPPGCRAPVHAAPTIDGIVERARLKESLGRPVDAIFQLGKAETFGVPSGAASKTIAAPDMPAGFDQAAWDDALRFRPGGLVHIDPASVVSKAPAVPYAVLPERIGLAKLLGDGTLVRMDDARSFRIARALDRFPPGLYRDNASFRFVVGKGIPRPGGELYAYCLVAEETGEMLNPRGRCPRQ